MHAGRAGRCDQLGLALERFELAQAQLLRVQQRFLRLLLGEGLLVGQEHGRFAVHSVRVDADDTFQLAQDITCLDGRGASTESADLQQQHGVGLRQLDLFEARDLDALAGLVLRDRGVEVRDLGHDLADLEVTDAGRVEDQVLAFDSLLFFQDRTDPGCL